MYAETHLASRDEPDSEDPRPLDPEPSEPEFHENEKCKSKWHEKPLAVFQNGCLIQPYSIFHTIKYLLS